LAAKFGGGCEWATGDNFNHKYSCYNWHLHNSSVESETIVNNTPKATTFEEWKKENLKDLVCLIPKVSGVSSHEHTLCDHEVIEKCEEAWNARDKLAKEREAELINEINLLRKYGNKDCTAMADEALLNGEGK